MKILYFSDLHLEFPQQMRTSTLPPLPCDDEYDVVVAAGDIGYGMEAVKRLEKLFPTKTVLFVPGNHEYYKSSYGEIQRAYLTHKTTDSNVVILNPGAITIGDVRFIGATTWSDCQLKGYNPISDQMVEYAISDFKLIRGFTAADMREIHDREVNFITLELNYNSPATKCVVITHFVPTQDCIHPKFGNSWLNPYFTNDLDWMMDGHGYPLHIFGHTHERFDQIHTSGTRLVGNPRGYPNENAEPFNWKIVEV